MPNWAVNLPIKKIDKFKRQVFGWASVIEDVDGSPLVDTDDEMIAEADLEGAVYHYVATSRTVSNAHQDFWGVATLIESFVVTTDKKELLKLDLPLGWWIGFKVDDDAVFARIVSGEISMLSIGGSAVREPANEMEPVDAA